MIRLRRPFHSLICFFLLLVVTVAANSLLAFQPYQQRHYKHEYERQRQQQRQPKCQRQEQKSGLPVPALMAQLPDDNEKENIVATNFITQQEKQQQRKKTKPIWSYGWLEGARKAKAYELTLQLQQSHRQSLQSLSPQQWIQKGMEIMEQWATLGEGDACAKWCTQCLAEFQPDNSTHHDMILCQAHRRVMHAYSNQFLKWAWDPKSRKPLSTASYSMDQNQAEQAIRQADALLERMEQISRNYVRTATTTIDRITTKPAPLMDSQDYTAIILGYAQLDQVANALHALRRIEQLAHSNPDIQRLHPNILVYSSIVKAINNSPQQILYERLGIKYAPYEMATQVGQDGVKAYRRAKKIPSVQLYNHMLNAYSRVLPPPSQSKIEPFVNEAYLHQQHKIATGADQIFDQMLQDGVEPNAKTFTSLIYTFTKSGWLPEAHTMMEGLMDYLFNAADDAAAADNAPTRSTVPLSLEKVDIRCVRMLANALAKEGAADQVQEIIFYSWGLHQKGYSDVAPDVFLYTTALNAWSFVEGSVDHAMSLMDHAKERLANSTSNRQMKPDVPMYNALMNVIAKQRTRDAADKIEALLFEMQSVAQLKPDIITYNTLMDACLTTTNLGKAEQTLQRMISNTDKYPAPNIKSYKQLIQALAPVDMIKAEKWLDRMEERFTPPPKLYELLVLQWCQAPNQVERAHALLERMEQLNKVQSNVLPKPKRFLYNAVMKACYDQDKVELATAVQRARDKEYPQINIESVKYLTNAQVFALLDTLDQDVAIGSKNQLAGTTVNFNVMLSFLAKSGEIWAGQRAEDVLNYMLELYLKRGNSAARPNIVTFNQVMAAWAKSSHPDAGGKAVATLKKLDELHKIGLLEEVQADRVTYNTIMNAYAKSDTVNSATMAENFFNELEGRYQSTGDIAFQPDIISYTTLLNAYGNSKTPGSAKRAEDILLQMSKVYQDDHSQVKPNTLCFNEVLYAWAKSQDPNALQRAEMILHLMEDMSASRNTDVAPNTRSYNIVLLAAASGPKQDAAIRAQLFFDRMKESNRVVPDAVTYNTVIEAYAKSGGDDTFQSILQLVQEAYQTEGLVLNSIFVSGVISSLSRVGLRGATATAETIVKEIQTKYEAGERSLTVDTNIYNALVHCWAKSGEIEAPFRAEEILQLMEDEASKGNKKVKPNVQTYTSVADCWAKSTDLDAGDRAEAILHRMRVPPSVHTYTTVIQAFARSQHPDKALRAQAVLQRMKDDFRIAKNPDAQPTIVAYNALMNACEFTFGDIHDVEQAFKVACLAFDEMRSAPDLKMDHVTYGSFLGVINELMPKSDIRNEMVQLVFKRCCSDGQLGSLTLKKLKETAGPALYRDCLNGIREDNFPASWSCNVCEK